MPIHDWTKVSSGSYHGFHYRWIAAIMDALNGGVLPDGFFALPEQYISGPAGDVVALEKSSNGHPRAKGGGGIAVALPQPKTKYVLAIEAEQYAAKANRIAVHHALGNVVAVIEIVSPGNKDSGNRIRAFREKAAELIRRGVNLLVVDLFPPGSLDPQGIHKAIWDELTNEPFLLPEDKPLTLASYQALPIKTAYIEPVAVGDQIPDMPLYLESDFYVNVPLEATYQATWNVLPKELKAWVEGTDA